MTNVCALVVVCLHCLFCLFDANDGLAAEPIQTSTSSPQKQPQSEPQSQPKPQQPQPEPQQLRSDRTKEEADDLAFKSSQAKPTPKEISQPPQPESKVSLPQTDETQHVFPHPASSRRPPRVDTERIERKPSKGLGVDDLGAPVVAESQVCVTYLDPNLDAHLSDCRETNVTQAFIRGNRKSHIIEADIFDGWHRWLFN